MTEPARRSTVLLRVDPADPDPDVIRRAAQVLAAGGLVVFPTETVYGLGANALDAAAVRGIFAAKGRPSYNPLIAHVPDAAAARALAAAWPAAAEALAAAFWPGPLTLVLPKRAQVPDEMTAGLPSVAVRVPAHPVALALLRAFGGPVAAPSANRFTELSPTTAAHVARTFDGIVDVILDGGPTAVGIESTVVDLTGARPAILRPGLLSAPEIERVAGSLAPAHVAASDDTAPRLSPGLLARHYAPRARLRVVARDADLLAAAGAAVAVGQRVGVLARRPVAVPRAHVVQLPADPAGYARGLYAALHDLDDAGCDLVLVQAVPDAPGWTGIRDRLERAAATDAGPGPAAPA